MILSHSCIHLLHPLFSLFYKRNNYRELLGKKQDEEWKQRQDALSLDGKQIQCVSQVRRLFRHPNKSSIRDERTNIKTTLLEYYDGYAPESLSSLLLSSLPFTVSWTFCFIQSKKPSFLLTLQKLPPSWVDSLFLQSSFFFHFFWSECYHLYFLSFL